MPGTRQSACSENQPSRERDRDKKQNIQNQNTNDKIEKAKVNRNKSVRRWVGANGNPRIRENYVVLALLFDVRSTALMGSSVDWASGLSETLL